MIVKLSMNKLSIFLLEMKCIILTTEAQPVSLNVFNYNFAKQKTSNYNRKIGSSVQW